MSIFPLDRVRNASINHDLELLLEDVREDVAAFPFPAELGGTEAALEVYDSARPRLNVLLDLIQDLRNARCADISCGLGFLPVLLARSGHRVVATETNLETAAFAVAHGIEVRHYRIGSGPPPIDPGSLQLLVFAEVLEHLKLGPLRVLRELAGLLQPDGRLLLSTPNVARLHHLEMLAAGENFLEPFPEDLPYEQDPTDHVEHVREYSIREVVDVVEAAGLAVEQVLMTGWDESGYHPLANPFVNEICVVAAAR
jgi:2-polyprenyl-3-methyl-5-hydroxy-6-metoxy-1,4-benzoquinol methylase